MTRGTLQQVVLVTGGRDYQRHRTVFGVLDNHHKIMPIRLLVQGGATGADEFARDWAKSREVRWATELPDWKRYGRGAGTVRNQVMLDKHHPHLVVAFPGNRGTLDMMRRAYKCGYKVAITNGEEHGLW